MQNLGCQIERCERPTVAHGLCKPHYMRRPLTEITDADVEKFWTRVDRSDPNGCWPWRRGKCLGYGNHSIGGRIIWTHRFAWQITHGGRCLEIPKGMQVCHTCDYRTCCNPAHLFLGTAKDNAQDRIAKGRGEWAADGKFLRLQPEFRAEYYAPQACTPRAHRRKTAA